MATERTHQPIVVTHNGGARFTAQIRSHQLIVDQPVSAGGADGGPMPIELLGGALGTCVALYVQQFCHTRGLRYEGMRVEVEQHKAGNPSRIDRFNVRVILPEEIPPAFAEMLERVARICPAHNTLSAGADVEIEIELPATTTA